MYMYAYICVYIYIYICLSLCKYYYDIYIYIYICVAYYYANSTINDIVMLWEFTVVSPIVSSNNITLWIPKTKTLEFHPSGNIYVYIYIYGLCAVCCVLPIAVWFGWFDTCHYECPFRYMHAMTCLGLRFSVCPRVLVNVANHYNDVHTGLHACAWMPRDTYAHFLINLLFIYTYH